MRSNKEVRNVSPHAGITPKALVRRPGMHHMYFNGLQNDRSTALNDIHSDSYAYCDNIGHTATLIVPSERGASVVAEMSATL